jgi:hypothetical protein
LEVLIRDDNALADRAEGNIRGSELRTTPQQKSERFGWQTIRSTT